MRYIALVIFSLLPYSTHGGSLYTFNKHDIQMKALAWIEHQDSELAEMELGPQNVSPYIKTNGEVEVKVYFTYKSNSEHGFNYVCVHMNEDGELLGFRRDVEVYKGAFGIFHPADPSCRTR